MQAQRAQDGGTLPCLPQRCVLPVLPVATCHNSRMHAVHMRQCWLSPEAGLPAMSSFICLPACLPAGADCPPAGASLVISDSCVAHARIGAGQLLLPAQGRCHNTGLHPPKRLQASQVLAVAGKFAGLGPSIAKGAQPTSIQLWPHMLRSRCMLMPQSITCHQASTARWQQAVRKTGCATVHGMPRGCAAMPVLGEPAGPGHGWRCRYRPDHLGEQGPSVHAA